MSGPEHYRQAEWLIDQITLDGTHPDRLADYCALAQVHATLALTAATVDAAYGEMSINADENWSGVSR
jgi:hypothetical protein